MKNFSFYALAFSSLALSACSSGGGGSGSSNDVGTAAVAAQRADDLLETVNDIAAIDAVVRPNISVDDIVFEAPLDNTASLSGSYVAETENSSVALAGETELNINFGSESVTGSLDNNHILVGSTTSALEGSVSLDGEVDLDLSQGYTDFTGFPLQIIASGSDTLTGIQDTSLSVDLDIQLGGVVIDTSSVGSVSDVGPVGDISTLGFVSGTIGGSKGNYDIDTPNSPFSAYDY